MGQVKGKEHFYDKHDPVRPVRIKCSPAPWITPFINNRAKPPYKKFATTETPSIKLFVASVIGYLGMLNTATFIIQFRILPNKFGGSYGR